MNYGKYTIEGRDRLKNVGDVQKDWLWTVEIPQTELRKVVASSYSDIDMSGHANLAEDFTVRATNAVIPTRGVSEIVTNFIGMEQLFAGKIQHVHDVSINFKEFEDGVAFKMFNAWRDRAGSIRSGFAEASGKRGPNPYSVPEMTCMLMKGDGTMMDRKIIFKNVWVQNISEVTLSYDASGKIQYPVSFKFDIWDIAEVKV